jgi:hypothetical protein
MYSFFLRVCLPFLLSCSLFFACLPNKENANQPLTITKVLIAKDDKGKISTESMTIPANDQTFHCVVKLNKKQAGSKVKITLMAVNAEGYENFEVRTLDLPTDSLSDELDFPFSLARPWFKGAYRCDVYLNEELKQAIDFSIQ